jgi:ribosomal protein S13
MEHQADVDSWIGLFEALPIIEMALLDARDQWVERIIDRGMRRGVRDHEARAVHGPHTRTSMHSDSERTLSISGRSWWC